MLQQVQLTQVAAVAALDTTEEQEPVVQAVQAS
jgi:hypothetical protein